MKRRIVTMILALALVLGTLVGCTKPVETTKAPETTKEADKTEAPDTTEAPGKDIEACTITYWTGERHDMVHAQEWIDKFNKENPYGIVVEPQFVTEDLKTMFQLGWEAGTACDIVAGSSGCVNDYGGYYLENLEEYAKNDPDQTYWNDMECATRRYAYKNWDPVKDEVYCYYGQMRTSSRIEYNKQLAEKHGVTEIPKKLSDYVDLLIKVGKEAADAGEDYSAIGFCASDQIGRFLSVSAQNSGATFNGYDYKNGKFDFAPFKPFIEEFQRLFEAENAVYPDENPVDNMRAIFAEQGFIFWQNASQEVSVFGEQIPVTDFDWVVAKIPTIDGEVKGCANGNCMKGYCINNKSEHKDAAWEFIKFIQSKECLIDYVERGYEGPMTTAVSSVVDVMKAGRLGDFISDTDDVLPSVPTINLTGDNYTKVLWAACKGEIDLDEAIEDLNKRYNEAYEADIASGDTLRLVIKDWDPLHVGAGNIEYLTK